MASLRTLILATALCIGATSPHVALAQDEDLDDLPDDFLQDAGGGEIKVKEAPAEDDEDPDFEFGDDPDWDAPPPPVPVPGGLDEDPAEDLPDAGGPSDEFFSEDPPDDFSRPAPSADPLDADPPEGGAGGAASPAPAPGRSLGLDLETRGKAPLADNYPVSVVARDLDAVVVELPVLIASKPADFAEAYWIITEVAVEERKVAESRHYVTKASIADMGPTVVWSKSHVPVLERAGSIEITVSQSADGADATPLFSKTVPYEL